MIQTITRYLAAFILLLASFISLWFLLNNLQPVQPALYSFALLSIIGVIVIFSVFMPRAALKTRVALRQLLSAKYFTIYAIALVIVIGTAIRFSFYFNFSYQPVADPYVYLNTAQSIANGQGIVHDAYVAFFPHLAAYDFALGYAIKVFGNPWFATIALNSLLDILAAAIVFALVKRLARPSSKRPLFAFCLWFLSPFNILFSTLSLPIIIVNFFVVAILLIVHLLYSSIVESKRGLIIWFSLFLGVTIGLANWFRPVFPVAIIALIAFYVYLILSDHSNRKRTAWFGASLLIVSVSFFGMQKLNITFVANQTQLPMISSGGWNIYVGSNSESDGAWNVEDADRKNAICKNLSQADCQHTLQKLAVARYKHHGVTGTLNLFIRKLYVLSSGQYPPYNTPQSIEGYTRSKTEKLLGIYGALFAPLLYGLSALFLYNSAKQILKRRKVTPVLVFASILVLGFFSSIVIVETSSRYSQVLYPMFILFASLASFGPQLKGIFKPNKSTS